jgi:hypothetical protein
MIPRVSSITKLFQIVEDAINSFYTESSPSSPTTLKPLHEVVIHGTSFFDIAYAATAPRLLDHRRSTETV